MEKSSFFNAVETNGTYDRVYKAEDFAEYFASFLTNGYYPNKSSNLQVVSNGDMTITVKPGMGLINGYFYNNDTPLIKTIKNADGVLKRIDLVVVRWSQEDRNIKCYVKTGEYSNTPVTPELTRNAEIYELGLAKITINPGVTKIENFNISDLRLDSEYCGVINSLISVDTSKIFNNLQEGFYKWFEGIQNVLDNDTAGKLYNRTEENKKAIADIRNCSIYKSNKDVFGNYATVTYKRPDKTTALVSQLNNLNASTGLYEGRTETYYKSDGKEVAYINKYIFEYTGEEITGEVLQ